MNFYNFTGQWLCKKSSVFFKFFFEIKSFNLLSNILKAFPNTTQVFLITLIDQSLCAYTNFCCVHHFLYPVTYPFG